LATMPPKPPSATIRVVYPKPNQIITAVDSTFILGSVSVDRNNLSDYRLDINGHEIPIHKDGGFLAFLPITPGEFVFHLSVSKKSSVVVVQDPIGIDSLFVLVPEPLKSIPEDSLAIAGDYRAPLGDLVLIEGDVLEVSFLATPGHTAWFSIPGVIDSVPMSETEPRQQPYWGEAVFGEGRIPDSVLIRGIYAGFYTIPSSVVVEKSPITYHLGDRTSTHEQLLTGELKEPPKSMDSASMHPVPIRKPPPSITPGTLDPLVSASIYKVSINPPEYPFTIRFNDSVLVLRHAPQKGYFSILQPKGVEALAVGAEGDWYKLRLSENQFAWVNKISVVSLPSGIRPPKSFLSVIRSHSYDDSVKIDFALSGKHPFRITELDSRSIRIQIFGVTSNTDWIRYDFGDSLVESAQWSQPEPNLYQLDLNISQDVWGYDGYYNGSKFSFVLHKPPKNTKSIRGKTIIVDPGHSSDPGSIGPTGYTEADANLGISLILAKMLKQKGANVIMTRSDTSHVALADRPAIARANNADLFVSIHNNALPDGINPITNNGVSTYYYHPHSINLAKAIQTELLKATKSPDYGLFYGNLAVNRPTQFPAVLVECAFMIIPDQEAMLKTDDFRKKAAGAVVRGIETFLKEFNDGK